VGVFGDSLRDVAARVPEAQVVMLMGTDGIPIDRFAPRPDANLEAVAAEFTTLLRASVSASSDTGLGGLQELCVVTDRMTILLLAVTQEYFLFAALDPDALIGKARFALRLAGLALERELR
jgi:predicted regulator of Ras-like GTPase activity (Roadblock/LC7/MglB family)